MKIRLSLRLLQEFPWRGVGRADDAVDSLHVGRPEIHHRGAITVEIFQLVEQSLWVCVAQLLLAHVVKLRVIRAILAKHGQGREVCALFALGVGTRLQHYADILVVAFLVGLGTREHVLKQSHRRGHVAVESADGNVDGVVANAHVIAARELEELLLYLLVAQLVGADIREIVGGDGILVVALAAERIMIGQREDVVARILLIQIVEAFLRSGHREVALEVNELGLYGLRLGIDDFFQKLALLVVVGRDRCYVRLFYLVNSGVVALGLEHGDVAIGEEPVGEVHYLALRHLGNAVERVDLVVPLLVVDESINEAVGALIVLPQRLVIFQLHVVHRRRQEVIGELALLQLLNLSEHEPPHLLGVLSLLWQAIKVEHAIIVV